jgi:NitT/TauT family transport system ATP-binding protein
MTPDMPGESRPALERVTVGFVPLIDAAMLVVAREEGFAEQEGLDLVLVREGSWAAIRDKLNVGLFDAAHMLAPAAVASTLGIGHVQVPLIAPVALNHDGNAITVSQGIAAALARHLAGQAGPVTPAMTAAAMASIIAERRQPGGRPVTIGVVFNFSCHLYQVGAWLSEAGLSLERDVNVVVIPPPLMAESMAQGHLDVFCAGAPWNRQAELAGAGRVLHPCSAIMPGTGEKLLVMRRESADAPFLPRLVRAIARAARWCGEAGNRARLARHLARPEYVGVPEDVIAGTLDSSTPTLFSAVPAPWIRLDSSAAEPSAEILRRILALMAAAGHLPGHAAPWPEAMAMLRRDLYDAALANGR